MRRRRCNRSANYCAQDNNTNVVQSLNLNPVANFINLPGVRNRPGIDFDERQRKSDGAKTIQDDGAADGNPGGPAADPEVEQGCQDECGGERGMDEVAADRGGGEEGRAVGPGSGRATILCAIGGTV